MISYTRERAIAILKTASIAVLATVGSAGVLVSEFSCEAVELDLFLLIPTTSDHLFNLEQDGRVAIHTNQWELTGAGHVLSSKEEIPRISLLSKTETKWYAVVKVVPTRIQVLRSGGWGPEETIDLTPFQ
jgi:hypothetical protein